MSKYIHSDLVVIARKILMLKITKIQINKS